MLFSIIIGRLIVFVPYYLIFDKLCSILGSGYGFGKYCITKKFPNTQILAYYPIEIIRYMLFALYFSFVCSFVPEYYDVSTYELIVAFSLVFTVLPLFNIFEGLRISYNNFKYICPYIVAWVLGIVVIIINSYITLAYKAVLVYTKFIESILSIKIIGFILGSILAVLIILRVIVTIGCVVSYIREQDEC